MIILINLLLIIGNINGEEIKEPGKIPFVELNKNNLITLRGVIDNDATADLVRKMNKFTGSQLYFYITSPGGSVIEGMQIIDQIKSISERNIKLYCIADFAASMAFAIFQSCPHRYVTSSSILMQHQMSLGIKGNLHNVNNYLEFIKQIDLDLDQLQAERIGLELDIFKNKIMNDWWLNGKNILLNKAADSFVVVSCNPELVDLSEELNKITPIIELQVVFSKCPISREPISMIVKTKFDLLSDEKINQVIADVLPSKFISKLTNSISI